MAEGPPVRAGGLRFHRIVSKHETRGRLRPPGASPGKVRFLHIAEGPAEECRCFLILAKDLVYGNTAQLPATLEEVSRRLNARMPPPFRLLAPGPDRSPFASPLSSLRTQEEILCAVAGC